MLLPCIHQDSLVKGRVWFGSVWMGMPDTLLFLSRSSKNPGAFLDVSGTKHSGLKR